MPKLFSGTANQKLAEEVSKLLNIKLAKVEIVQFGNSETKVTVCEDVKNEDCVIIQSTGNPADKNIVELLLFCDALQREEAKSITAVIPYFGYAKQNIQHRKGECVSVNVVIRMLEAIGFHKVITFDIHDEATAGIFSIPFKHATAFPTLAKQSYKFLTSNNIPEENIVLVSPDQGAVEKVRNFGQDFYQSSNFTEAVIEKKRDQNIMHKANPVAIYGNVRNKVALIVDDMVVSGSTLLPAIDLCLDMGAREVYAAIVHHDFTIDAPGKIQQSKLKKLFTTNSITLKTDQKIDKLMEFSLADLIAKEIKSK